MLSGLCLTAPSSRSLLLNRTKPCARVRARGSCFDSGRMWGMGNTSGNRQLREGTMPSAPDEMDAGGVTRP